MPRRGNARSSYRAFQAMQRGGARAMKAQERRFAKEAKKAANFGEILVKGHTRGGKFVKAHKRKVKPQGPYSLLYTMGDIKNLRQPKG